MLVFLAFFLLLLTYVQIIIILLIEILLSSSIVFGNDFYCNEKEEKVQISELLSIEKEMLQNDLKLQGTNSLRLPNVRPYMQRINNISMGCASEKLYKQIILTLHSINFPENFLNYMLVHQRKILGIEQYVIGSTWDRVEINEKTALPDNVSLLLRSIVITGYPIINTGERLKLRQVGTAMYLGKIDGLHLVGTAIHVFNNDYAASVQEACMVNVFHFPIGPKFAMTGAKLIGAYPEIEFAICALDMSSEQEKALSSIILPIKINWNKSLNRDLALTTIGFGVHKNEHIGLPLYENSNDCKLFFGEDDMIYRDNILSAAIGCYSSAGDSGSPVVDRITGELIGIIWGVREEKRALSSENLNELRENMPMDLWNDLTIISPINNIKTYLKKVYANTKDPQERKVLKELLDQ